MKRIKLLCAVLCGVCWITGGRAQVLKNHTKSEVFFLGSRGMATDSVLVDEVIDTYYSTIEKGFRQTGLPRFIIAGRDRKMIFGIGGNVSVRLNYDFEGMIPDPDFVTSLIPVPGSPRTRRQVLFDPSTSGLYFKAIAHAGRLGPVVGYVQTDFRGGSNRHTLSLQMAYVEIAGFSVGRRFTTFCDLGASPATVDFEGPNGYSLVYRTMVRYRHRFGEHWSVAAAAEMPDPSVSYVPGTSAVAQRMPDFPVYVRYGWNEDKSHLRLSAVFRDIYFFEDGKDDVNSLFGWGIQFSGAIQAGRKLKTYMQFLYGEGIAAYIQDIAGEGLDLAADPRKPGALQTLPAMSWIAGLQYEFSPKWIATAAYSGVKVFGRNDYRVPDTYRIAHYLSANLFYHLTGSCQIGAAYLYGTRRNMDDRQGHANRTQAIVQYNF